jgi:hypothetical protein
MYRRGKLLIIVLAVAAIAVALTACAKKVIPAQSSAAPKSAVSGYYSPEQGLSGGQDLHSVNLRDIQVERNSTDGDTIVTLTFKDGSLQMGMEETPTKGVPKYSTQWIDGVDRLVLDITGLAYWDYEVIEDEIKDSPILGVFKQSVENTELTRLFFNLKSNVIYKIHEKDNQLVITMRAMPADDTSKFYVELNAYDELSSGKLTGEEGLLPSLCSDKQNITLISKPYASSEEANAFLETVKKDLLPKLPGKSAMVVEVKGDQLPKFNAQGALDVYTSTPVVRREGKEQTAPIMITNGSILCWRNDGMAYVYASPFFLGEGSESTSYVKLYLYDVTTSKASLLTDVEFNDILQAEFSDDGQYVAFIDQGQKARVLYIKDTTAPVDMVMTASEAGLGVDTASFTWGSNQADHTIFAITGEDDMLQMMSWTLKGDGEPVVQTLVEQEFTEGSIGYFGGKVYYSQSSDQASKTGIFVYDPSTRKTRRLSDGSTFELNRKTGNMAIQVEDNSDTENDVSVLKLYNPSDNTDSVILDGKPLGDSIVWSNDGMELYYTVYYDNVSTDDRYKMALFRYDMNLHESKELMDITEGLLSPSDRNSEVLLTYIYNQANQFVPITYKLGSN